MCGIADRLKVIGCLVNATAAEGYIRSADLAPVQDRYALSPDAGPHANVRLHVVAGDEACWLFNQHLPAPVVTADLLERDTPRDRSSGEKLARQR